MKSSRPCMHCEAGHMRLDTRDVTVSLGDLSKVVKDVHGWFCDQCDEIEFADAASAERYAAVSDALLTEKKVRQSAEIRRIRKKLRLTQQEAADIFGGGVNAFSRYELGKVEPPRSVVKLLEVLGRHPDLLDEVR
ncbi:XRE family transcriptional regulator [Acidihalobacter aeolianus]|uniref:XRE family transcriptional regulator n=2 Tax=Acidihalobacter aeolianus TaxID=2792603 RepID=A0A1D8KC92_9GAMM|nr:type II TA system antitoxin MqsA family protein [Acidihalobacter aeolianus]AOV18572.1 XRE family transcriptional regulator [Acidihalobacter aeolianus]